MQADVTEFQDPRFLKFYTFPTHNLIDLFYKTHIISGTKIMCHCIVVNALMKVWSTGVLINNVWSWSLTWMLENVWNVWKWQNLLSRCEIELLPKDQARDLRFYRCSNTGGFYDQPGLSTWSFDPVDLNYNSCLLVSSSSS